MPQAWRSAALAGCATTQIPTPPPAHQLSVIKSIDRYSPPASQGHFCFPWDLDQVGPHSVPHFAPWPPVGSQVLAPQGTRAPTSWAQSQDAIVLAVHLKTFPARPSSCLLAPPAPAWVSPVLPVAPKRAIFLTTMPLDRGGARSGVAGHAGTDWLLVPRVLS